MSLGNMSRMVDRVGKPVSNEAQTASDAGAEVAAAAPEGEKSKSAKKKTKS
ncbi:MAG: hypothetical protein U5O39_15575 [Gammaproteobacteria bacterium]|nr:hypothetical protein [Gammaproteobacteria bacterium]